ncbi:Thiol-disulfide oxidoreductase ResA [Gemmata sp. SH-PL17]|uniref:redoxin domain-containing protein n=1 Tax=Gemmata sp. SH-PL17 TaxID=1630693 RepID=UPI00078E1451|nr:redoxin domain-containing protein [Gemmata sp. SH-PL17]AMV25663.1 Thiol-disulfide oxidoreductase ResA [Gemmata sp. SH-PL17]
MKRLLVVPILLACAIPLIGAPAESKSDPKPVANFTLTDTAGGKWSLTDQKAKAIVFAFLSCECPMSNGYVPALADVATKFAEKGVVVVGIHADPDESVERVAKHTKEYKISFPVLRDPTHAATAPLGAKTTPEVVILDEKFVVRYRGRIDDGYSARMKPKATVSRHDLTTALDEILAGKAVSVPETKALGCPIPDPVKKDAAADAPVTFYKDVLPVMQNYCQSCHRPDQVGPFSLVNYKQVAKWADTSLEEMHAKRMPPWKPAPNPLLTGARAIPDEAVKTVEKWIAGGKLEGDPKDAPAAPKFPEGWTLGEPDLVLEAPSETTIAASGKDHFRVVVFPTNLPEDKFVVAMEVKPGNPRVVHHTLQLVDTSGKARALQAKAKPKADDADHGPGYPVSMGWGFFPDRSGMLGGWAPGAIPKKLPDGIGQKLPKGADVCVQFHYHRTGKEEKDRTKIGLYFAKTPVKQPFRSIPATGVFLSIPAGEKEFKVDSSWKLTEDVTLYRLSPHMHLLGKDIEMTATVPDGKEQTLVRIPAWDYNWQEQYELKEPMKLPKGTVLRVRATYDNSASNPHNPSSPPQTVRFGEQTTNEMCFVFLGVSTESKATRLIAPHGSLFRK